MAVTIVSKNLEDREIKLQYLEMVDGPLEVIKSNGHKLIESEEGEIDRIIERQKTELLVRKSFMDATNEFVEWRENIEKEAPHVCKSWTQLDDGTLMCNVCGKKE